MNPSSETRIGTVERAVKPDAAGELLTYPEWKARGRQVLRGERGVKVPAWAAADGSAINTESTGRGVRTMVAVFSFDQTRPDTSAQANLITGAVISRGDGAPPER